MPHDVIMPALGMAQDTGKIVSWLKQPGDAVAQGDPLFEVETDKAVMEVEAQANGFLGGVSANAGDDVPVGSIVAIIAATAEGAARAPAGPDNMAAGETSGPGNKSQALKETTGREADVAKQTIQHLEPELPALAKPALALAPAPVAEGRILASPKAKWLAHAKGLDLLQLVQAGAPQPYHARDIETLAALPSEQARSAAGATLHIQAKVPASGLADFLTWMREDEGIEHRQDRIWTSFAAGALRAIKETFNAPLVIELAGPDGELTRQVDPDRTGLSQPARYDATHPAALIIRDLGETDITSVQMTTPQAPVISVCKNAKSITLCLDFTLDQWAEDEALSFIREFAARLKDPLHQLL